jgi:hypothetical protein
MLISLMPSLLLLWVGAGPARAAVPRGPWLEPAPDVAADLDAGDTGLAADEPAPCPHWILRDGVELPELPELYHRMRPSRAYGTPELIDILTTAAAEVQWQAPHADRFVVGDLSKRGGGRISGHKSHMGGIDADVGLYFHDGRQHAHGFLEPNLPAFDVETNWLVIRTMLDTGLVDRILIDRAYVLRLRRHAVEVGDLTAEEAARVFPLDEANWWWSGIVHHHPGHKDHLHVRVRCER